METGQRGRVIVGVDGSVASLRALRQGVAEARRRNAPVTVVHVRQPARPNAQAGLTGFPDPGLWPDQQTVRALDREAEALIATCIDEGLGSPPTDVALHIVVGVGTPAVCLMHHVRRDDDLLVIGTRGPRRWRHLLRASVGRCCIAYANCPVLVVPPDSFARDVGRERRWYRSLRRHNVWAQFDHQVGGEHQQVGDA